MRIATTFSATQLLRASYYFYLDASALAFVWVFLSSPVTCFHALLGLTRDTHFLLFLIVNSAASFALDAHRCNNTTGSRGKELHRAGHRKSLLSPIPPLSLSSNFSTYGFHAHGVQASGLGSRPSYRLSISCHFGFASTTDGLRFGSSLQDISSGRPHGQNLVYPAASHYYYHHLSILLAIAFYNPRVCLPLQTSF